MREVTVHTRATDVTPSTGSRTGSSTGQRPRVSSHGHTARDQGALAGRGLLDRRRAWRAGSTPTRSPRSSGPAGGDAVGPRAFVTDTAWQQASTPEQRHRLTRHRGAEVVRRPGRGQPPLGPGRARPALLARRRADDPRGPPQGHDLPPAWAAADPRGLPQGRPGQCRRLRDASARRWPSSAPPWSTASRPASPPPTPPCTATTTTLDELEHWVCRLPRRPGLDGRAAGARLRRPVAESVGETRTRLLLAGRGRACPR